MAEQNEIVNRVSQSSLVSIDLETFYPQGERVVYDLAQNLFQGLILKEKDFRAFIKDHDWPQYKGKHVAITCSADAIIPTWAYMLLSSKMQPYAATVILGGLEELEKRLFSQVLSNINPEDYTNTKVVIKGCSGLPVPDSAYVDLTTKLRPYVSSIMFGEPCSTVPVYKAKKSSTDTNS